MANLQNFAGMNSNDINTKIILFFENIQKYYGSKTEISEAIFILNESNNDKLKTWNLSEFTLIRSAYRENGQRFMLEGAAMYYEIAAKNISNLEETGRNKFEFTEQYSDAVFRTTKIRFHCKY